MYRFEVQRVIWRGINIKLTERRVIKHVRGIQGTRLHIFITFYMEEVSKRG